MQQVITISPGGLMSGLQHKKGKGVDLRQFGHAEIERASEIKWMGDAQKWGVFILTGPFSDRWLTHRMWMAGGLAGAGLNPHELAAIGGSMGNTPDDPVTFDEYEEAVEAEVSFLNALRRRGLMT